MRQLGLRHVSAGAVRALRRQHHEAVPQADREALRQQPGGLQLHPVAAVLRLRRDRRDHLLEAPRVHREERGHRRHRELPREPIPLRRTGKVTPLAFPSTRYDSLPSHLFLQKRI